ncbi:hypothetical protein BDN70DRAFT_990621 [Pholiota conissans]|uniref:HNH nuclease domain-containing protein n=1 Tax=Pholiota conissans TaxID=109636 RepID=A0A9P5ZBZ6_9AGAR|nr:hypothetical protein BDN70DRAFT_990621 [Pholiota conissans]
MLSRLDSRDNHHSRLRSYALQKRIEKVAPDGPRCLLENCPKERGVELCHIVGRRVSKNHSHMSRIEWYWHMQYKSLNLNSRYNTICLGASLHRLHDIDDWALLPPMDIVVQYEAALITSPIMTYASRSTFPQIPNAVYAYRLFPIQNMHLFGITRQDDAHEPNENSFTSYVHPYDNFPDLLSHLHPRFAILEFGRKMTSNADLFSDYQGQYSARIRSIFRIYTAWTSELPKNYEDSKSYKGSKSDKAPTSHDDNDRNDSDPSEPDHEKGDPDYEGRRPKGKKCSENDEGTEPRRVYFHRQRSGIDAQTPGLANTRGRYNRAGKQSTSLFQEALVEHEKQVGEGGWTTESVSNWWQEVVELA